MKETKMVLVSGFLPNTTCKFSTEKKENLFRGLNKSILSNLSNTSLYLISNKPNQLRINQIQLQNLLLKQDLIRIKIVPSSTSKELIDSFLMVRIKLLLGLRTLLIDSTELNHQMSHISTFKNLPTNCTRT